MKQRILILCTGNSARSQMGEGLLRELGGTHYDVYSAGTAPTTIHPLAITVMNERGIDIRHQRSKSVQEFLTESFAYVMTVCDQAAETCPVFPGYAERIHWSFPDPATVTGTLGERTLAFRHVRDALERQLRAWLIAQGNPAPDEG